MEINLTMEQRSAIDTIMDFAGSKNCDLLTLGGYAGTGKTTIIGVASKMLGDNGYNVAYCALSGKAAQVLRGKINLGERDYCGTIHGLIYFLKDKIRERNKDNLVFEMRADVNRYDLIVVDEASMVNERIFNDLKSLGVKILAIGDHGQLPPIPDFRDRDSVFNLMKNPDIKLTKILRQAEDNPIIKVSILARETGVIPYKNFGGGVIKTFDGSVVSRHDFSDENSIILCGRNSTRTRVNSFAREKLFGAENIVREKSRVICLMNDYQNKIFNGDIGIIESVNDVYDDCSDVVVNINNKNLYLSLLNKQFLNEYLHADVRDEFSLFDYAYAITVHKSQGSEYKNVLLYDEPIGRTHEDRCRWIYTAVTRAKNNLIILKS